MNFRNGHAFLLATLIGRRPFPKPLWIAFPFHKPKVLNPDGLSGLSYVVSGWAVVWPYDNTNSNRFGDQPVFDTPVSHAFDRFVDRMKTAIVQG